MIRLSASSIKELLTCPRKYKLSHMDYLRPEKDADALIHGTAWHAAFEGAIEPFTAIHDEFQQAKLEAMYKAYMEYYAADDMQIEKTEFAFECKIMEDARIVGRVDAIAVHEGRRYIREIKTTSSALSGNTDLWQMLRSSPQVSCYILAATENNWECDGILYDVSRKPALRPSRISKKELGTLFETFTYCGETFAKEEFEGVASSGQETPKMYGARVAESILAKPEEYFARHVIPIVGNDLDRIRREINEYLRAVRVLRSVDAYYPNYGSCDQFGGCCFKSICFNSENMRLVDAGDVPKGFMRKDKK